MADPAIASLQTRLLERMELWSSSSVEAAMSLGPAFRMAPTALLEVLAGQREPLVAWFDQVLQTSGGSGDRRWRTDPTGFLAVLADHLEHLVVADWFDLELPQARWGTIISHLAFSLQFLHQHLRGGPGAERYARTYMQLLRALRVGGTFAYAPSLPFIEDLLPPSTWRVVRRPIALSVPKASLSTRLLRLPFQASQVERLA